MAKRANLILTFEILTTVTMQAAVFWNVTPCTLAIKCQSFGGICCLILQGKTASCEVKWVITWDREKGTGALIEPRLSWCHFEDLFDSVWEAEKITEENLGREAVKRRMGLAYLMTLLIFRLIQRCYSWGSTGRYLGESVVQWSK